MLEISVVEHGAMHYAAVGKMIERVTRDLLAVDEYVVTACGTRIDTQPLQGVLHHEHVPVEGKIDVR